MITVRSIDSVEDLVRVDQVIAARFPPRRSAPSHGLDELKARFAEDRSLMLVAESDGEIVGGALAFRVGVAVKVDVVALKPDVRRLGIGRRFMETIEIEAIRLGTRALYLGGANAENRAFYWRLGFARRRSLMQKALPSGLSASGRLRLRAR